MAKKKTLNDFVTQANIVHNNKYGYTLTQYLNGRSKIDIICLDHGVFCQTPDHHLEGQGCPKCGNILKNIQKILTTEEFIKRANIIHDHKYGYSKTVYVNTRTVVVIICLIHGEFNQTPDKHLNRMAGCAWCAGNVATRESFINKANDVHKLRYGYSKFDYINSSTKSIIICKKHGEFLQTPGHHLQGNGCPKCGNILRNVQKTLTTEEFIKQSNIVHNNKYSYEQFFYKNSYTCGIIVCPSHGDFSQRSDHHIRGHGCPKCSTNISNMETAWLDKLGIQGRNIRININNIYYKVDGFDSKTNTVYEFYGDFWHGNPNRYNSTDINKANKKSFGHLYDKTIERENCIKAAGYNLITIWESDWKSGKI